MSEGTIITFYSYKGGVGRTFALANIAALLSTWGYKVLCIDWDLEAPGLQFYFQSRLTTQDSPGLVEFIDDYVKGKQPSWRDYTALQRLASSRCKGRRDSQFHPYSFYPFLELR
ncbi:MAG: AAA family ATPase [Ktedonobacteraceae bacterium]|nr:AAA family ATPase [Ktedonobacteraceae bacterium]